MVDGYLQKIFNFVETSEMKHDWSDYHNALYVLTCCRYPAATVQFTLRLRKITQLWCTSHSYHSLSLVQHSTLTVMVATAMPLCGSHQEPNLLSTCFCINLNPYLMVLPRPQASAITTSSPTSTASASPINHNIAYKAYNDSPAKKATISRYIQSSAPEHLLSLLHHQPVKHVGNGHQMD